MAYLDRAAFGVCAVLFIVLHVIMIAWLYWVPLRHRKEMKNKDECYRLLVIEKMKVDEEESCLIKKKIISFDQNHISRHSTFV